MVILDEHGIEQPEAMIVPAAAPHGVLFQGTPARSRFARIVNRGPRTGDRGDEPRRQGRDPAEPLEKVEGGPLHRQQRTHRPVRHARSGCPGSSESPSAKSGSQSSLSSNSATNRSTAGNPASTPADRATRRAAPRAWLGIVAVEVMSPDLAQIFGERQCDQHIDVCALALAESDVEEHPSTCTSCRPRRRRSGCTRTSVGPAAGGLLLLPLDIFVLPLVLFALRLEKLRLEHSRRSPLTPKR